jgi:ketosteroid isomerase-like protein
MTAVRSAEEVFAHHGQALGAENLEEIISDYADDAILISQEEIYRGKDGARAVFTQLLQDVPQADWALDTHFADDVLYLEWKARGRGRHVGTASTRSCSATERSGADDQYTVQPG